MIALFRIMFAALAGSCLLISSCVSAPKPQETESRLMVEKRAELYDKLVNLLPPSQQQLPDAQKEARWLADTAYKGAAAVARVNRPLFASWINNRLVNSSFHWRERGLCWHYQHDLYRELRRRPLHYYRLGCCVMDRDEGSEHHCVYIAARHGRWPEAVTIDAWWNSGRLKVWARSRLQRRNCVDEPEAAAFLNKTYPEGHRYPMEHWAKVRADGGGRKDYLYSNTKQGAAGRQGRLMIQNCKSGLQRRGGRPTDY